MENSDWLWRPLKREKQVRRRRVRGLIVWSCIHTDSPLLGMFTTQFVYNEYTQRPDSLPLSGDCFISPLDV